VQNWLTAQFRKAALEAGRTDMVSLWSGQSAPLLKHRRAAELMQSLAGDASARWARMSYAPR
jgi:nitronate monooxygenase